MGTTQEKGDIGLAHAISDFTEMGYYVSIPITESAQYDLIVDNKAKLCKVQVKYSTSGMVDLRRIHSNSNGYQIKLYEENAFDLLYVYVPGNGSYLIDVQFIDKNSIKVKEKYKIKLG